MPTFSEEKFEGHEYRIEVTPSGIWLAVMDRVQFRAETLHELQAKVRAAIRRANARLDIPATIVGIPKAERQSWHYDRSKPENWPTETLDVIIRGYDSRKRAILYSRADEPTKKKRTERQGGTGSSASGVTSELGLLTFDSEGVFVERLSPGEAKRFSDLVYARQQADQDLIAFVEKYRIRDVNEFIEAEVERRAQQAETVEPVEEDPRVAAKPRRKTR